ncbi:MAG: metal-dependent hydrolase [Kutzneria sp.]|nr:metal-dependent hydrolase [Kutzneria sp.]
MSTGPTHAMSGLLVWGGVSVAALGEALPMTPQTWIVGAVLCSGAALLPDLDHPEATVAHTFGPLTHGLSKAIHWFSHLVYRATRTRKDANRHGGHRGVTHTLVFAVLAGLGTMGVVQWGHKAALIPLLFLFCALAVRGLLHDWTPKGHALGVTALSLGLTVLCWHWIEAGPPEQARWCAAAVSMGCLAHCLGDAITEQGCPILWPVPFSYQTWYPVAPPKVMRMRTGGKVELGLLLPVLTVAGVWMSVVSLQRTGLAPWISYDLLTLHHIPPGLASGR